MKTVYRNVTQVVEKISWNELTKGKDGSRLVVLGSCSDLQTMTSLTARIKVIENNTTVESCKAFLCVGASDDVNNVRRFKGSQVPMSLTVGAVTELNVNFSIGAADVSDNLNLKIGTAGNESSQNYGLGWYVSWEVEYILQ